MIQSHNPILAALAACETASPYTYTIPESDESTVAHIVDWTCTGEQEILIVSDMHLASGRIGDGNYSGTENFFADGAFARFLGVQHEGLRERGRRGILIINGDFVDLLRVVRIPSSDADIREWKAILDAIGMVNHASGKAFHEEELRDSVSDRERKFGMKTNDYKSVWKLACVAAGHTVLFDSLASWVGNGHELVIVKGNHDLEWIWQPIRDYFRLMIAERLNGNAPEQALRDILGKVRFVDDALLINKHLYIEHGQRFDRWTRVLGPPLLGKFGDRELNIPMGSFMNRYVLNRLEETYPFIDNVRPQQDVLPMVMREHLPMGLRIMFKSVPVMLGLIRKRYFRYMFHRVIPFLLGLAPLIVLVILYFQKLQGFLSDVTGTFSGVPMFNTIASTLLAPVAGYFWMKFVAWFQLDEPGSLAEDAHRRGTAHPAYRCIVLGHTHNPEQSIFRLQCGDCSYFNTGTWIPVIETSTADLREDKTYAFLHLAPRVAPSGEVEFAAQRLQRWNDDAMRCEDLVLLTRKGSEE